MKAVIDWFRKRSSERKKEQLILQMAEAFEGWLGVTVRDWMFDHYTESSDIRRYVGNHRVVITGHQSSDVEGNPLRLTVDLKDNNFEPIEGMVLEIELSRGHVANLTPPDDLVGLILKRMSDKFLPVLTEGK